jgi:hypothetical protein
MFLGYGVVSQLGIATRRNEDNRLSDMDIAFFDLGVEYCLLARMVKKEKVRNKYASEI